MAQSKRFQSICRICLTASSNMIDLKSQMKEKYTTLNEELYVLEVLEEVVSKKVIINEIFPKKICQMCLSLLKIAYDFKKDFLKSQRKLEEASSQAISDRIGHETCGKLEESNTAKTPTVELIVGENKYNLNDLLVVEQEETEASYEGFLANLGSEVSATFAKNDSDVKIPKEQPSVTITKCKDREIFHSENAEDRLTQFIAENDSSLTAIDTEQLDLENISLSQLLVNKSHNESEVQIIDSVTNTILKVIFECKNCGELYESKSDLVIHEEVKHFSRKFICDKCGHVARTQSQFYHHMRKHKGRMFQCTQCEKKYDSKSKLEVHLAVHKNERSFLCSVCGKSFNYSISLTYHMRLHCEKKFVCNVCGLKFRMPNTLKRHIQTHTNEKPFICNYCPKAFCSRGEKTTHEMIHTGVRPYHCEYCGKGFIKTHNLKMHYLSHPGRHECQVCYKTFLKVKFLKLHLKRVHEDYDVIEISDF